MTSRRIMLGVPDFAPVVVFMPTPVWSVPAVGAV